MPLEFQVIEACHDLSEAFALLSPDRLAPSLLAEIETSLKQLYPLGVLEKLSRQPGSTTGGDEPDRDEALQTLRQLLEVGGGNGWRGDYETACGALQQRAPPESGPRHRRNAGKRDDQHQDAVGAPV